MSDAFDDAGLYDESLVKDAEEINTSDYNDLLTIRRHFMNVMLRASDDVLRKMAVASSDERIQGIRQWPHTLSDKQRWRLAEWIYHNMDEVTL